MKMKIFISSLLIILFFLPSHAGKLNEITVDAGNSSVIKIQGLKRIVVGNSQIIKVKSIGSSEILIFGMSKGNTTLDVWKKSGERLSYKVTVLPSGLSVLLHDVSKMLRPVSGASASIVGEQVVIEGDNLSDSDRARIKSINKKYPEIMDLSNHVGWDRMVLLDVQVLEIPLTKMKELGVRWDPTMRGGMFAGVAWEKAGDATHATQLEQGFATISSNPGVTTLLGVNTLLSSKIHALTRSGEAVVLAQPQLLTRNGTTASFLAGGEIPYASIDKEGKSITTFRKYGVSLNITPEVDRSDTVRSKIDIEVSSVDATVNTPGGPALKIRKASSDFNVKSGQTLVIGGFISRERHADRDGLPGLSEIPVAGYLFGTKRDQLRETELAIFVTPVVVGSKNPSISNRVDAGKEIMNRAFPDPPLLNLPIENIGKHDESMEDYPSSQWMELNSDQSFQ